MNLTRKENKISNGEYVIKPTTMMTTSTTKIFECGDEKERKR